MKHKNFIYGKHPVLEALKAEQAFEKVFVQKNAGAPEIKEIMQLCRKMNVPCQFVPGEKLNSLTRKNHQGVAAYLALIQYYNVEDVLAKAYDEGRMPLFLILDHITDVRNLGAIARSAECYGADAIIIPEKGGAMVNGDAMKASAGALNLIHVCKVKSLEAAVKELKLNGIQIFSSAMEGKKAIADIDLTIPAAILLGAEDTGVSRSLNELADKHFFIPMTGQTESLNVSVAAGIILYESMRQRSKA